MSAYRLIVAEPTYADGEHASINGLFVQAITHRFGPVLFAATSFHHACVKDAADPAAPSPACEEIVVLPPGGIHFYRIRAQWSALGGLIRSHLPQTLILLSAGSETLFVARALVAKFSSLRIFAIMHGNLADVVGWRSRDPRHRLIDLRSGLKVSCHERIRLVVLESYIRDTAVSLGLGQNFLVWPHPCSVHETPRSCSWSPRARLRLTFIGTANRQKGFDDFISLQRSLAQSYDWALAGRLGERYSLDQLTGIERLDDPLSRASFLREVRKADYAFMAYRPEYLLTASGSLTDCITQRKPIIAIANPVLTALAERYGPIGYLCADLAGVRALLSDPAALKNPEAYALFQRSLAAISRDREPGSISSIIARDLSLNHMPG